MTSPLLVVALVGGGLAGLGVAVAIAGLIPAAPALGPALARLHPTGVPAGNRPLLAWLRARVQVPHADLAILGRSGDQYLFRLGICGLIGLLTPVPLTVLALVLRLPVPLAVPFGATLVAAGVGVWLAHHDVVAKAAAARADFVRAMCTYLDLAAHQVLSGSGPVQALDRAARICDGWVFSHLRGALLRAQLEMRPPWDELKQLSGQLGVLELADLADIMRSAGSEGAHVYQTLRARADSLRDQLRTSALEVAEVRTNKLDIPAAALILVLLVLVGFPFMINIIHHP